MDLNGATLGSNGALFCRMEMPLVLIINPTVIVLILFLIRYVINHIKTHILAQICLIEQNKSKCDFHDSARGCQEQPSRLENSTRGRAEGE